jgi:hypothetical protein
MFLLGGLGLIGWYRKKKSADDGDDR